MSLTPSQVKPNVDIEVVALGREVLTSASVLETPHRDLDLVLHHPAEAPQAHCTVRAILYHDESSTGDAMETVIDVGKGSGDT